MKQNIFDQLQPYLDEYCRVKPIYNADLKKCPEVGYAPPELADKLIANKNILDAAEESMMKILFENNCDEKANT